MNAHRVVRVNTSMQAHVHVRTHACIHSGLHPRDLIDFQLASHAAHHVHAAWPPRVCVCARSSNSQPGSHDGVVVATVNWDHG